MEENSENPRQPPKREGDPDDQEGQPIRKRSSTSGPANPGTENAQDNVGAPMRRIFGAVEQLFGHSMVEIGQLFVRNEVALRNSVRNLRVALRRHQGHMEPCMEEFLEALGPGPQRTSSVPLVSDQPPVIPILEQPTEAHLPTAEEAEALAVMSERSAKEILRLLGRILDMLAQFGGVLDFDGIVSEAEGLINRNRVVHVFGVILMDLGELMQYTYRSSLNQLADSLETRLTMWKSRMDTVIANLNTAEANPEVEVRSLVLQPLPRLFYPEVPKAGTRYQIGIPTGAFHLAEPEIIEGTPRESQPHSTIHRTENTLMLRYRSETFLNGQRTSRINFQVEGINFGLQEAFNSNGWVHPDGTDGQFIRWLEFDVRQFEEGTAVYRIEERIRTTANGEAEGTEFVAVVSGILKSKPAKSADPRDRIEIAFVFPSHLTQEHINDVGIRDGVIKIQFSK